MLCDSHIHIGQFYDIYTSPDEMNNFLKRVGVDAVAVSSTTTCEENFKKVVEELRTFCQLFGEFAIPVLWVTPSLLSNEEFLTKILNQINWKCLKVHPQLCPDEWDANGINFSLTIKLARILKVPILIHTGVVKNCHPLQLKPLLTTNQEQVFILAHGRPFDETIQVMREIDNIFVDTAFMPIPQIVDLVKLGYSDRILWGSDYPIIKFHERSINYHMYYKNLIEELKLSISDCDFVKITQLNFRNLFNLNKT